jgi:uncharacterized protein YdhG (YjbR/CyaY superfamily)
MSASDVDGYLAELDDDQRDALQHLRRTIREAVPEAEECISYGMPAFKIRGKTIAGFAAFKNHLSYLPHSGSVLSALGDELTGYQMTKGSLHFAVDEPLPADLVNTLITARMRELGWR